MMVQKARLFGDEGIAERMLGTTEPRVHKALGRKVEGFDGGKWDAGEFSIFFCACAKGGDVGWDLC